MTVKTRLLVLALSVFRRLPSWLRRRVISTVAPSYTVGAVAVIRDGDGSVLLLRERHHEGWSLPGGLLGRREGGAEALVRELNEELDVTVDVFSLGVPIAVVDAAVHRIDLVYDVMLTPSTSVRPQPPEVIEAQWFATTALPEPLFTPSAGALRAAGIDCVVAPV
jgi:8-oxo-dGTP diphosphatase